MLLLTIQTALALCAPDHVFGDPWIASHPEESLPRGAVPWVSGQWIDPAWLGLRDWHGGRVPVWRVGRERVRLVPLWPLWQGRRYTVVELGQPVYSFDVAPERDRTPPSGGEPRAWVKSLFGFEEGTTVRWSLSVAPLDEPAWMEAEFTEVGTTFRVVDRVQEPGTGTLASDRFVAQFSPETLLALGGIPAAVAGFAGGPCGGWRLPMGHDVVSLRFRYLDAAGNVSDWRGPYQLEGARGDFSE